VETHSTTMTSTSIRGQGTAVKVQVMSLALAPVVMVQGAVGAAEASEAAVDSPAAVVIYGLQARSRRRLRNSSRFSSRFNRSEHHSSFNHSFSHSFSRHYHHLISNTARICTGSSSSSSSGVNQHFRQVYYRPAYPNSLDRG